MSMNLGEQALGQMWAKTGSGGAWHRLAYHLLDVAAVARLLLERHVPSSLRLRHGARLGLPIEAFDAWCVFLAALHDFGKATPPFQIKFPAQAEVLKRLGLRFPAAVDRTPHGEMTSGPETRDRLMALGWPRGLAQQAVRWVGGHHGVFPTDLRQLQAGDRVGDSGWLEARAFLFSELVRLFAPAAMPAVDDTVADIGLFVAGLTSVADWIGSMSEHFSFETGPVSFDVYFQCALETADRALTQTGWRKWEVGGKRSFPELFGSGFEPRPLQSAMARLVQDTKEQFFAIVEAPMGEGKTEAAFWVAHHLGRVADHRGVYVALPTMATANQMFARTKRFLESAYQGPLSAQLLHGGADFFDAFVKLRAVIDDEHGNKIEKATACGTVIAEEWFSKRKRGLLAPFAVGTIDQALLGVMRTRHGFVRLFGLTGKTVILDEVHAYDAYTSRILDRLVAWLRQIGATVVILSATLPRARREALCRQWEASLATVPVYPRITAVVDGRPESEAIPRSANKEISLDFVAGDLEGAIGWLLARTAGGGCAGLILNTVDRAQTATRLARQRAPGVTVLLLHARYFTRERQSRERELLDMLGNGGERRPERVLVIGTQVLEQSLDIDFDVMATDHAPIDLLLQRTGRLHRHERPRPLGLVPPTLAILLPESPDAEAGPDFGVHALIYEEAVLLRSWAVLHRAPKLCLPGDIEPLIEKVYDASVPEAHPGMAERMYQLDQELAQDIRMTERDAEGRLLADPKNCIDDPFSDFALPLDEENPDAAKAIRAITRLGEPTVQVACLTSGEHLTHAPSRDETKAVVERTLSLSNRGIVFALRSVSPPDAWQESPWLRNTRALVFEGGRARIGDLEFIDDPDLGLVISKFNAEDA